MKINAKLHLYLLCLLLGFQPLQANSFRETETDNVPITLAYVNKTVKEVIGKIEKDNGYIFFYLDKSLDMSRKVSINVQDGKIEEVLDQLFDGTEVSYYISDRQVMLSRKAETIQSAENQQTQRIKGIVQDALGPLAGVNILEKGTTNGTISNMNGEFILENVPVNATLVISYIGFVTQQIPVNGQTEFTITLNEDSENLDEVVVVGYGVQKKSNLTGSVASIKPADYQTLNIDVKQAIQGRVAGVDVSNGSIIIRGAASIQGSSPLWIVDGVPGTEPNFNDIESIEILKDAASTAIYGAQGAGGVILVTTKKGKAGKIAVNFQANLGASKAIDRPNMLRRDDYIRAKLDAGFAIPSGSGWEDASDLPDVNWNDYIWQKAFRQNYFAQILGGNERTTFSSSLGYYHNKGLEKDNVSDGGTFRLASDTKVSDKFSVSEVIYLQYDNVDPVRGITYFRQTPMMSVYDEEDGGYGKDPAGGYFSGANPLQQIKGNHHNQKTYQGMGNLMLTYQPIKGLTLHATFFAKMYSYIGTQFLEAWNTNACAQNQSFTKNSTTGHELRMLYTGTYEKTFLEKNLVKVMGGYEAYKLQYNLVGAWADGFPTQVADDMSLSTGNAKVSGGKTQNRSLSWFGRLNYSFDDKYLLEGSIRRDGYDNFAPDNRHGYFPSVSAGWNISRESFFENVHFVDILKLRGSWGKIGNNTCGQFLYETGWTNSGMYQAFSDGDIVRGFYYAGMPNKNIKWETVTQWNVGLDATLLDGRLTGTIEYYDKETTDMLYQVGIPASSGSFSSQLTTNIGEIRNKGLEISLGWRDQIQDFNYNVNVNLSHNKNKVVKLSDDINTVLYYGATHGSFLSSPYRTEAGQPMGQIWGYVCDGIFQSQAEVDALNAASPTGIYQYAGTSAGDLKWRDVNGDGKIDADDRTYIGNPWPKYTLGININMAYKGFEMMLAFTGAFKVDLFNSMKFYERQFFTSFSSTYKVFEGWSETNTNTSHPRVIQTDPNYNFSTVSSYYVENGNYLKLKTFHFGYNLPVSLISKIGLSKLQLFVNLENPIIFTKFQSDPELGGNYLRRNEYGGSFVNSPQSRSYMGGISLTL